MNELSLKSVWNFFDAIYYLDKKCPYEKYYNWYDIPIVSTKQSIERICKSALKNKYKNIIIIKKNIIPTKSVNYFNILQLINFIKENNEIKWDIITLGTQPDIYYSETYFLNDFMYKNSYSENSCFVLGTQGMNKIITYDKKKKYLHYHPNLFQHKDSGIFSKCKELYGIYVGTPVIYSIFFLLFYIAKHYIFKIIARYMRRPQINVIVRNHNFSVPDNVFEYRSRPNLQRSYSF